MNSQQLKSFKKAQEGSLLLVLLVGIILIGAAGVLFYQRSQGTTPEDTSSSVEQATPKNEPAFKVDDKKLPSSWSVVQADDTTAVVSVGEGEGLSEKGIKCFAQATLNPSFMPPTGTQAAQYAYDTYSSQISENKGYESSEKKNSTLMITDSTGKTQTIESVAFKVALSDGSNTMYKNITAAKTGTSYVQYEISCGREADVTEAAQALLAIGISE